MMDARRNQVYAGVYRVGDMLLECVTGQKAVSIEDYIAELNDLGDPVTVLGDGVPVHREALQQGLNVAWKEAPAHMNRQSAASVAVLGARYYDEGKIVSPKRSGRIIFVNHKRSVSEKQGLPQEKSMTGMNSQNRIRYMTDEDVGDVCRSDAPALQNLGSRRNLLKLFIEKIRSIWLRIADRQSLDFVDYGVPWKMRIYAILP